MSRFFGRLATVIVAREVPLLPVRISSPIRIQFKVEKQPYTPPNTCDICITNLSEATRKQLQEFGADVELRAGYESDAIPDITHLPLLFRGQARTIDHVRNGSEWLTRIQCGDGETAYRYAMATVSRAPGSATADILKDLAKQLVPSGVDISAFVSGLPAIGSALQKKQFVTGFAAQGNALQELDKILAPEGYIVSVQNGELQVISSDGATSRQAVRLSADSGMLGSPEHGSPDKNGLPSILKIPSLLQGRIGPMDPLVVDSVSVKASYRAEKVIHTGDTHGPDWKTDIEARPLNGPQSSL